MTIPFRPVPRVASRSATHKEAEMVRHPKTLIDFMQMYPTEEDCRQALFGGVHLHEVAQRLRMPHHLRLLVGR